MSLGSAYEWLKVGHLFALIAWMAGMLYLPRLFVYHCGAEPGSAQVETFKVMERRLLRGIMTPAMIGTWLLGLALAWQGGFLGSGWLHAKLTLVLVLSGMHGFLAAATKRFARDANTRSARFYRVLNEVPAVILVAILVLVVLKPF